MAIIDSYWLLAYQKIHYHASLIDETTEWLEEEKDEEEGEGGGTQPLV